MSKNVLIFANPIAGRGRGATIAARLNDRLAADGWFPRVVADRPDQADLSDAPDARAVIVIGGDGTVRAVAQQLYHRKPMPPLLPVPMGTANLMGRHLGVHWNDRTVEQQVSASVRRRQVEWLDAGRANGELFMLMAGVGIDARVVHLLDKARTGPITYASYAVPAAQALGFYDYPPLTVTVDGVTVVRDVPAMAFVGNVSEYGTGFPMLPHAHPHDGLLDVCVLPCSSAVELIHLVLHAAAGDHMLSEGAKYLTGRVIRDRVGAAGADAGRRGGGRAHAGDHRLASGPGAFYRAGELGTSAEERKSAPRVGRSKVAPGLCRSTPRPPRHPHPAPGTSPCPTLPNAIPSSATAARCSSSPALA